MSPAAPSWVEGMSQNCWYAISGDRPSLGLQPTPLGTRYLADGDPARDPSLNPARTLKERLRRMVGRDPRSPWHGVAGFSAITEAWNSAVYASRFGPSGSMIVFGERLTSAEWLGIACIGAGLVIVTITALRAHRDVPPATAPLEGG